LIQARLGARRAVLMHVAHRRHRVLVHHRRPERKLERDVGRRRPVAARRRARRHALGARPPRQRDQRDVALAGDDRLGGVGDVDHIGRAAALRRVDVADLEPHVVGHREATEPRRVARAEVAVHVGACEPGVPERAGGGLSVQLRERFVVGLARGMLEDAGDVGLALDRHVRSRDRAPRRAARPPASGGLRSDGRSAADRCRASWAGSVSSRRCRRRSTTTAARRRTASASLPFASDEKKDAVDCTAAQAVAAALLASAMGNTVMASGPRLRLRSSGKFSALLKMLRAGLT